MSRIDDYEQYVQKAMQSWNCPGLALAVVKGNNVIHQSVLGWRDVENQLPMTEDTRFAMASVTKSVTAMSVAQVIDDGKLDWDKPVREYMPEFILDDPYVTQHVTVRDMLCHRTGLPRHDLSALRLDISRAEFIKRMKYLKFNATFREKFQYNNLMYYEAAYLVEKLAGQKWEDFVQQRIFSPLKMTASNFNPEPPAAGQFTAKGYRIDRDTDGSAKGLVHVPFGLHTELSPGAAGALFSTLADLIQWLKVHVNNGRVGEVQIVSPENLQQMHLPQMVYPGGGFMEGLTGNTIFTYGMGWFIEPYRGYTLIHHGGDVEGHSLIIAFVPQEKIGVVVLTNIAMVPLRDVLLYESIDRALDLPDRDWNKKFHEMYDPIIVGEAQAKQTAAQEKIENAPPTHPRDNFVGMYQADGYPDFAVRMAGDGMQACLEGILAWSTLRHYHYNIFEWHLVDFDAWMKVRFLINDVGEIDSVSMPIEPAVENQVFTRKQPEVDGEIIAMLVGRYDTPIEGVSFSVAAQEGKVTITQTGGTAMEVSPYKISDDTIGFKWKRNRFDFVREKAAINRMALKTPAMTIEALRK